ncbi:hypothetical protein SUDANB176_00253 [Streptomyces sp. enrichment culture]
MIGGILHRVRTGVQWRDLPERFGPWKTVYERHRLRSADCPLPSESGQLLTVRTEDLGPDAVTPACGVERGRTPLQRGPFLVRRGQLRLRPPGARHPVALCV